MVSINPSDSREIQRVTVGGISNRGIVRGIGDRAGVVCGDSV